MIEGENFPLTNRAYTWYVNRRTGSVHDWKHLASLFNTKFFSYEAKFKLVIKELVNVIERTYMDAPSMFTEEHFIVAVL